MADADFRATVSRVLDEFAASELHELLKGAFSVERLQTAVCPHCDEKVTLRTPDYRGYAAALSALDGIGKGNKRDPAPPGEIDDEEFDRRVMRALERAHSTQLAGAHDA